ncbi:2-amino-4-hydroxy-6-hydroxymethyldihydropteridine diphosphokinase [Mangrovibacterium sp.]|uniref:2-amino-4-hydroxy-6- hydroxymethyldihydropteridine diphosphokinase n=1 Tax=Mangrovibacterium sp. TaxID=1961364 RepID=UPI003561F95D
MNQVYVSIGSNIHPQENIRQLLEILTQDFGEIRVSEFVKTKPIGIEDQADFVNGAVVFETELDQVQLQKYLKSVENKLGRDRSLPKFGPRTMDLDLVVWNGIVVDDDFYTRDFLRKSIESIGFK